MEVMANYPFSPACLTELMITMSIGSKICSDEKWLRRKYNYCFSNVIETVARISSYMYIFINWNATFMKNFHILKEHLFTIYGNPLWGTSCLLWIICNNYPGLQRSKTYSIDEIDYKSWTSISTNNQNNPNWTKYQSGEFVTPAGRSK